MSVSKMEKLTAVLPREDADALLRRLMRLKAVSLIDTDVGTDTGGAGIDTDVSGASERVARVGAVLPVLQKRSTRKFTLFRPQVRVSHSDFRADGRYDLAWKLVAQTEKILHKQKEIRTALDEVRSRMQSYTPYLEFDRSLNAPHTQRTSTVLGAFPGGTSPNTVVQALAGRAAVVQVLYADGTGLYVSVLAHREEYEQTMRALSGIGFLQASFPDTGDTPKALFDRADRERLALEEQWESMETQLRSLAERVEEIEILSDIEETTLLAEKQKRELQATQKCAVICCWCPVQERERVTRVLQGAGAAYDFAPPAEGDDPPVLLRNNAFARNFEWVLGMYAYPAYGKFDPTFIMSIFYMIIFGLMFADAGYGLVLSAACFLLVRYAKPREGMKRFLLMFGYCGLSCIVCGVLFGSYFGNFPLAFMENFVGSTNTPSHIAVLFDPLQDPMTFLVVSLGIGAVHLIAGMAVQGYILCRKGKVLDALFDIGSYWLLFAGIAAFALGASAGVWILLSGVVAILATQGRAKKGIAGKLLGGFGGIYGLINYASDLLSYSRILALGLASAVVGQVVNILATLKGGSFIGFLLMVVVFCVGHLLNLVINVLGTFVHTARLQYIEFFGKFYEDGGTPFKPIAAADRYSEDTTEEQTQPVTQN